MKNAALILERFDYRTAVASNGDAGEGDREQRARAEGYAEGYAAGQAAAAAHSQQLELALSEAARALEEALVDAPQRIIRESADALKIIIENVFPALARTGFAIEAADAFRNAAAELPAPAIELFTAPEHVDALQRALGQTAPARGIVVKGDAALTGAAGHASWSTGGLEFDLDQTITQCLAALEQAASMINSESKP